MLRLLLDEHLSPRLVKQFQAKCHGGELAAVLEWQGGRLIGAPDETLLTEAHRRGLTLVTYDQAPIAPLLKSWAEQGVPHRGVVFIDDKTIRPDDFGVIVRALRQLWKQTSDQDWLNRLIYLTRPA